MLRTVAGTQHDDELSIAKNDNLLLWRVVFVLIILLVACAVFIMNIKENTFIAVKLPPKIKVEGTLVVGLKKANKTYYDLWGIYLADEVASFTVDDINEKMNLLIDNMRPSVAIKKIAQIDKFKEQVVLSKMSQNFTPLTDMKKVCVPTNGGKKAQCTVLGIARQVIDGDAEPSKECEYTVYLEIYKGVLYVEDFGSNCF